MNPYLDWEYSQEEDDLKFTKEWMKVLLESLKSPLSLESVHALQELCAILEIDFEKYWEKIGVKP